MPKRHAFLDDFDENQPAEGDCWGWELPVKMQVNSVNFKRSEATPKNPFFFFCVCVCVCWGGGGGGGVGILTISIRLICF